MSSGVKHDFRSAVTRSPPRNCSHHVTSPIVRTSLLQPDGSSPYRWLNESDLCTGHRLDHRTVQHCLAKCRSLLAVGWRRVHSTSGSGWSCLRSRAVQQVGISKCRLALCCHRCLTVGVVCDGGRISRRWPVCREVGCDGTKIDGGRARYRVGTPPGRRQTVNCFRHSDSGHA